MDSYIISIPTRYTETVLPMLRVLGCKVVEVRRDEVLTGLERLHHAACDAFGVRSDAVRSNSTKGEVFRVRAVVMLIAHHDEGVTYESLARFYGRHYTTVQQAVNRIGYDMQQEPVLREKVRRLRAEVVEPEPDLFRTNGRV